VSDRVSAELLEIAEALLPGVRLDTARLAAHGNIHHVVLLPGLAAVRISRRPTATETLPRRMELLKVLAGSGLPFAVPEPLTPVISFGERAAVAVSWIDGTGMPEGQGDPARIGELLAALRDLPLTPRLRAALIAAREDPQARDWREVLVQDVVPRLPERWREDGERRVAAALALEPVPDVLVHGDLGAENVHWGRNGKLVGVLDWDLAIAFDPAIDAASMAWHGWDNVRAAVDDETYRRARVWDDAFGVGHLTALLAGRQMTNMDSFVQHIVAWLEQDAGGV
jgi:aminoglycoside phosphotransferase (APT) family kinase protein